MRMHREGPLVPAAKIGNAQADHRGLYSVSAPSRLEDSQKHRQRSVEECVQWPERSRGPVGS